jgi:uncharacterized membrane protein
LDLYSALKFLHVSAAIVWIGGGFCLVLIALAADRRKDSVEFARILASLIFMAEKILTPAALLALATGLVATWMTWDFSSLWIILGLIGYATTFLTGNLLLTPRAKAMTERIAREGLTQRALEIGQELVTLAKFDYVVMFAVVADMVFKPTTSDWLELSIIGVAVVGSVIVFVLPVLNLGRITGRHQ